MTACSDIESKLTKELDPSHLEVIDESYLHNVEPGKESHVRIVIVSEQFENLNLVKRHQLIYQQINEELEGPIHAISLHTFTDSEWKDKNETAQDSPDCLGGMKKEDS
ncbi:BolA/IbaG family iron-sulfur metabolism protein [Gammaproteobacteria bacterium]|nr:BolA/IbaG family iron-sulfur metabolism protein [Gammaproteobacteria bacterium]